MAPVDFESLLETAIGLDAASIGSATVERAVRLRMATLGLKKCEEYWQQLHTSTAERQELIEAVVVPETWFFRDREAFTALVSLLAEESRTTGSARFLRLLSVPCSSGEEPYSMVMSLLDAGVSPQQFQVDAADISARVLARAKRGVYGNNSFRSADLAFRERYFQQTANEYALVHSIRAMVRYRQANLLSADFCFRQEKYDVIFCRNLLIYFGRSTQERAIERLAHLLAPGGVLFVGPAEAYIAGCSGFSPVNQAMSFAFRKPVRNQAKFEPPVPPNGIAKRRAIPRSPRTTKANLRSAPTSSQPNQVLPGLETARRLADAGQLPEAAEWCEKDLLDHGPSAEAYYLLGLVRDALGDPDAAATLYRKAIYLEPEHVEGLLQLAVMTEAQGDAAAGERLRERARRVERRTTEGLLTPGGEHID